MDAKTLLAATALLLSLATANAQSRQPFMVFEPGRITAIQPNAGGFTGFSTDGGMMLQQGRTVIVAPSMRRPMQPLTFDNGNDD